MIPVGRLLPCTCIAQDQPEERASRYDERRYDEDEDDTRDDERPAYDEDAQAAAGDASAPVDGGD